MRSSSPSVLHSASANVRGSRKNPEALSLGEGEEHRGGERVLARAEVMALGELAGQVANHAAGGRLDRDLDALAEHPLQGGQDLREAHPSASSTSA
jgi:hypothetical protein